MGQIDERINDEQILLTDELAHKELFDALIFDKSEFTGRLEIYQLILVIRVCSYFS